MIPAPSSNPAVHSVPRRGLILPAALKRVLRRGLHALLRAALILRSRPFSTPAGTNAVVLVIAPHPDDEALGCGGLMARKRRAGGPVHVAYVTDGSSSHRGHPLLTPAALAELREAEARQAMQILGLESSGLFFLKAQDGRLAHLGPAAAAELSASLARVIEQVRPGEIFLPCRHDGSSEHEAAFMLVRNALVLTSLRPRLLEFPVWSWWNPLRLIRPLCTSRRVWRVRFDGCERIKREAVAAYGSQVSATAPWVDPLLSAEFVAYFSTNEEFFFEH